MLREGKEYLTTPFSQNHYSQTRLTTHDSRLTPLTMDSKLLDILVCPLCKGPLLYRKAQNELVCKPCRLAYPVNDGIPVMLEEEARKLAPTEEP